MHTNRYVEAGPCRRYNCNFSLDALLKIAFASEGLSDIVSRIR